MTTQYLKGDVARDEGLELEAYPDPLSPLAKELLRPLESRSPGWALLSGAPWTIGNGHTGFDVHQGLVWTPELAAATLDSDLARSEALLDRVLPWWHGLNDPRQDVLVNMVFNMGWDNPRTPQLEGLSGFVNTLAHIKAGEYIAASQGMLASAWARQVKGRATRLALQMRTGIR